MTDDVQIPPTTDPLDEEGGRALVEAWRVSGMSGAAFCRLHNLRGQRLHYWRERLGYPIKVVGDRSCAPRMVSLTNCRENRLYRKCSGFGPHGARLNPPQKKRMAVPKVSAWR